MNKNIFWELVKELDWPNMCKLQNKKRYSLAQEIFCENICIFAT